MTYVSLINNDVMTAMYFVPYYKKSQIKVWMKIMDDKKILCNARSGLWHLNYV